MLIVALPLLILQASRWWTARVRAKSDAYLSVQNESEKAARLIDAAFVRAEGLLGFLAGRSEITLPDPGRCSALLEGIPSMDPLFVNVSLFDAQGHQVCGSASAAALPVGKVLHSDWFVPALTAGGFRLSQPFMGELSHREIVMLSLPLATKEGSGPARLLSLSLSIEGLAAAMSVDPLPRGSSSLLIDSADRIVSRNPNPLDWVRRVVASPISTAPPSAEGPVDSVGADGVERIYASILTNHFGLRVATSVPAESVVGPLRKTAAQNASVVVAFALLAGFLAWQGSRRLASPLHRLMLTARLNSEGDTLARAPLQLPGEFGELAAEFNRMLDARGHSEGQLRRADRQSRRMATFYEALSKTNRAIASQLPPKDILDAICRICVDTGCARTAWIAQSEGSAMTLVALAGWTHRGESERDALLNETGPSAMALRQGVNCFVNDPATDPRVAGWQAIEGWGASGSAAAFPIRRGGLVCAALTLYVEQPNAFDAQLVRLVEEMAADAAFGLDNYDKAQASNRRDSQWAAIVETATDAIVTVDPHLTVRVFNAAACRVFGVSAAAMLGSAALLLVPHRFRDAASAAISQFMTDEGDPPQPDEPREFVGLRSSGEEFPLQATLSRVGVDGRMLVTMVLRDVSALRESEARMRAAAVHEAANLAKTHFLSNMSHELRTPLTAVTGFAQLLLAHADDRPDPERRHQLEMILLAGRQLTALVDDVLDVSRIEVGRMGISMQDLELHHNIDIVLKMCHASALAGAITFVRGYAHQAPLMVRSDPVRLRQVLLNVVTNAIKYNRRGGTVRVDVDQGPETLCIKVTDSGIGLSRKQTEGLFEPFNRLGRELGEIPGTGIGLMLSRQLMELMGGSISLSSVEGIGTEVQLCLPSKGTAADAEEAQETHDFVENSERLENVETVETVEELAQSQPIQPSPALHDEPSGTVLYIEDNHVNVLLVEAVLRPWTQVRVVIAVDGAAGLEQAFSIAPDLILLDIHLPDADGIDVLKRLRADPRTADLPIVALSASVMAWETEAALDAGATSYWSKPIDFDAFRLGVAAFLNQARAHSPAEDALSSASQG
jgi:PAS domain S-box-containing protein